MRVKQVLLVGAALAAITASAHHGWSSYESGKMVKIEAPLVEVKYRNPHAEAVVDYQGERWDVVLAPMSRMEARGLPEHALVAGEVVTIEGYPRADGSHQMRAERITVNGRTIELR